MLKIIKNPDREVYKQVYAKVAENDGYCPCKLVKNDETKCPCKEFLSQENEGVCHCGLYVKEKVDLEENVKS